MLEQEAYMGNIKKDENLKKGFSILFELMQDLKSERRKFIWSCIVCNPGDVNPEEIIRKSSRSMYYILRYLDVIYRGLDQSLSEDDLGEGEHNAYFFLALEKVVRKIRMQITWFVCQRELIELNR